MDSFKKIESVGLEQCIAGMAFASHPANPVPISGISYGLQNLPGESFLSATGCGSTKHKQNKKGKKKEMCKFYLNKEKGLG